ncbi:MAG: hypothetical protein ACM3SQ_14550 [Betaproteobacteria bacterium]
MRQLTAWMNKERFALGLLLLAIAASACLMPAQSDTWWQLRAGEAMWHSHRVMLHDEFTYTVAGRSWPNHEWLTQVLFYGAYRIGGMPLLTLLCAAAVTAAWAFVVLLTPGPPLLRVAIVGAAAMSSSPGWSLRPQVLTLAMCAATLWILVRRRPLCLLPPLFLVWANLHGAVALGGVLIVAAWLAAAVTRSETISRLTVVGALCLVATAVTPLGASLWLDVPASLARLHAYNVSEWRAPQLNSLVHLPLWLGAAATFTLAVVRRRRLQSSEMLTLVGATMLMFVLATRSERNIPPFLVCAAPTIATLLTVDAERRRSRFEPAHRGYLHAAALAACALAAGLFVAFTWRTAPPRLEWNPVAPSIVAAIRSCPGRLYNRYDEGGYLIWFMRDRKVFIDNRQDPFPEDLVLQHIRVEQTGDYRAMFDRYDIDCSLTPAGSPLAVHLRQDGWNDLGGTPAWRVYRRPDAPHPTTVALHGGADPGAR